MGKLFSIFLSFGVLSSACVPRFLDKYSAEKNRHEISPSKNTDPATPGRRTQQTIVAVDGDTFRLQLPYERVWDATLDVLLSNYNLQIAEKSNGLITTEWDSYYLDGKIHRNKISMRIKRLPSGVLEMSIHNNVEVLSRLPDGGVTEVWLPSDRTKSEIGRIIQNVAIATGQPKPNLPQEMTAQGSGSKPQM